MDEAVQFFSSLDKQCHVQLLTEAAAASGIKKSIISDEDAAFTAKTLQWWENMYVNVSEDSLVDLSVADNVLYSFKWNIIYCLKRQMEPFCGNPEILVACACIS